MNRSDGKINVQDIPKNFRVLFVRRSEKRMEPIYEEFREFCKRKNCFEVIAFLETLAELEFESFTSSPKEVHKNCNKLYNQAFHVDKCKYRLKDVNHNLNVKYDIREKLRSLVHGSMRKRSSKRRLLIPSDFNELRDDLFELCDNDIYLSFQASFIKD